MDPGTDKEELCLLGSRRRSLGSMATLVLLMFTVHGMIIIEMHITKKTFFYYS